MPALRSIRLLGWRTALPAGAHRARGRRVSAANAVLRTVVPGVGMIAVTFGLARYGYGLLLPDMQASLGVDTATAGLIASGAYVAYLAANFAVVWLTARFGPRLPIGVAAGLAAAGMFTIAAASGVITLSVGVLVAGAAAGVAFPPYADVVAHAVPPRRQALSWSAISSGTGWGVALAGPVAILLGARWRIAWLVFALLALAVGILAVRAAPRRATGPRPLPALSWSWLICPRSRPLLLSSVLVGVGSSIWWAFSVDALRAGGLGETAARSVLRELRRGGHPRLSQRRGHRPSRTASLFPRRMCAARRAARAARPHRVQYRRRARRGAAVRCFLQRGHRRAGTVECRRVRRTSVRRARRSQHRTHDGHDHRSNCRRSGHRALWL